MNKSIILIFFAFLGLTIVSGRVGLIGNDPKTWSPTPTVEEKETDKCDHCKEFINELDEFIDIDESVCEKVCSPKKISWFTLFG